MKVFKYIILTFFLLSGAFAAEAPHCLTFEDPDDYVYIDDSPLRFATRFTIECWFNIEEFVDSAALIDFVTDNLYEQYYFGYGIFSMDSNRIAIRMGNFNKTFELQVDNIKSDIWYHLAVTYDRFKNDENVVVFLNGQVVKKADCDIYLEYPETFRPYGVMLGAYYDYPFLRSMKGQLDDVRFWSVVRTNEEIIENRNKVIDSEARGLVGYYTFDQEPDSLLYDSGPNENHGKLMNMSDSSWQLSYAHLAVVQPNDISFDRLVLPWISSSEFTSYCVDVSQDTSFSTSLSGFPVYDITTDYLVLDDIDPGTYYYRVKGHYDGEVLDQEPWSDIQVTATMSDAATPIELSNFSAVQDKRSVRIDWTAASQSENAKFLLERSTDRITWNLIYSVDGAGTTSKSRSYAYTDRNIVPGKTYYYRLKDISYDGDVGLSPEQEIETVETAEKTAEHFSLISLYPNPFNPRLSISLELYDTMPVEISIYSLKGEFITTICHEEIKPGLYTFNWTPVNEASGVYLMKLSAGNKNITRKLLYMK